MKASIGVAQDVLANPSDLLPVKAVDVQSRPRPEYDPLGIQIGGLTLDPELVISETYDDNIYATQNATVGDLLTTTTGSLGAGDQFGLLSTSASGNVSANRYLHNSVEDYVDYGGSTTLGYALDKQTSLSAAGQYQRTHVSRQDPSFPTEAITPPAVDTAGGTFDARHSFIDGSIDLNVQYRSLKFLPAEFDNGVLLSQSANDHAEVTYDLRGNLLVGSTLSPFVRYIHKEYDFSDDAPSGGRSRNVYADTAVVGTTILATNLMKGEIGVGVLRLRNHDVTRSHLTTISVRSNLEFFVSQLTTLTATVERDSGAADLAGSTSFISTNARVSLDHELLRNVILSGSLNRDYRIYSGISASETTNQARAKARWLLNRSLKLELAYTFSRRNSQLPQYLGNDFTDQMVDLQIELAY